MGPNKGEPYCPCVMKQRGLTSLPTDINTVKLKTALGKIFNWSKESSASCQRTEKPQKNF